MKVFWIYISESISQILAMFSLFFSLFFTFASIGKITLFDADSNWVGGQLGIQLIFGVVPLTIWFMMIFDRLGNIRDHLSKIRLEITFPKSDYKE